MCVNNGAPKHPNAQDERQKGMQELWDLLKSQNAVYYGDSGLVDTLDKFLKQNKVKRGKPSQEQEGYIKDIEQAIKRTSLVA